MEIIQKYKILNGPVALVCWGVNFIYNIIYIFVKKMFQKKKIVDYYGILCCLCTVRVDVMKAKVYNITGSIILNHISRVYHFAVPCTYIMI